MNGKVWNATGKKTFVAAEALEEARRVKINADGKVEYADADALGIGVTDRACSLGDEVTVNLFSSPGTLPIAGSEAIALGKELYAAADGKVQDLPAAAGTYLKVGFNVGNYATTADGGVVEALVTPTAGNAVVVS